jgi:cytidylate kinase
MIVTSLAPSVEQRLRAYHDLGGRAKSLAGAPRKPTITISREFGCEGYPIAEELVRMGEKVTQEQWLLVDLSLLNAVAKEHNIPEEVMLTLGRKPRWLDDMFATLSPHWKTDADYYNLLKDEVVKVASAGNAVIVGLAAAVMTQKMPNCHHFRLIADQDFRFGSISHRMNISRQEAELLVLEKEKERDRVIRKVLDADESEPGYYHAIFNNRKIRKELIADAIAGLVLKRYER